MYKDGSIFISHPNIALKLAACNCVAMQLPSDQKQLALAAHSIGALEKSGISCVFFTELSASEASELARRNFREDFRVATAEGIEWKRQRVTPREAPLIVAELPVTKAATTVEELQAAGHTVLYVGATDAEVDAVSVATLPGALGLNGCKAVQNAADVVLLSDFLGSLAFAKHRCVIATASPEKFVLYSLCPKCSPVAV